nr:MAG TPA: WCCH motif protein [Caudoviricetes sp.]DAL31032.1 MAG TPA_asm: WCCH motif protein [Caudoviricetes sp.]
MIFVPHGLFFCPPCPRHFVPHDLSKRPPCFVISSPIYLLYIKQEINKRLNIIVK